MGIRYLPISVTTTTLSFVGLQVWTELSLDRLRADGLITKNISLGDSEDALELLLASHTIIILLACFVLNVYILMVLSLKTLFFGDLYAVETKKLVERLANYIIYKLLLLGYFSTIGGSTNSISGCPMDNLVDGSVYFKDVSSFG